MYTPTERRSWLLCALGHSPLIRRSDRLEALSIVFAIAVCVLAIPLALSIGKTAHTQSSRLHDEQMSTRHVVAARAVSDSTTDAGRFGAATSVVVRWAEGPTMRDATIRTRNQVKAGEELRIWVDDTGKVASAPMSASSAMVHGLVAGFGVWAGIGIALTLLIVGARTVLDRIRSHGWDHALMQLADDNGGWAKRPD